MADFLLYGLNELGETAYCELLRDCEREAVPGVARRRLRDWAEVEVWEGPVRLVRLRRPAAPSPHEVQPAGID